LISENKPRVEPACSLSREVAPWIRAKKVAILSLLEALRQSMKSTHETRILPLWIHDALAKARIPGYLEVYECGFDCPLAELSIQVLRNNFAQRSSPDGLF